MTEKANILFDESVAATLRDAAASLNLFISRGPGAGELGNIKALMDAIASAYQKSPEVVRASLLQIVNWRQKHAPDARPWIDLTCGHTWLADADEVPEVCPVCGDDSGQTHTVTDVGRVGHGVYRAYQEDTVWARMANRSLELSAQEF